MQKARKLNFLNTAVNTFKLDEATGIHQVRGYVYSKVQPTPLLNPNIIHLSKKCFDEIGLSEFYNEIVESNYDDMYAKLLCGNQLFEGSVPISHNYCGHQFGVFAGQLGDGRAITIGDIQKSENKIYELQFKGSGLTPYSRHADGRAVLRSSIREYLASEYMHALGIPTTRAASLVVSDTRVKRDPLYDGRVVDEKCAVVLRVAPTFMRFGSFEIFKETDPYSGMTGPCHGLKNDMMPQMLDYVVQYLYPHINSQEGLNQTQKYTLMFEEIVKKTAQLVALWQCFGFCHGVLNTDNMSILGLTIDYGPYQFMEYFNQGQICNHSDSNGRYSYENQPKVCKWNLIKLAEALDPFIDIEQSVNYVNSNFDMFFTSRYLGTMGMKLGFLNSFTPQKESLTDGEFQCIQTLIDTMQESGADFTNTFRILSNLTLNPNNTESILDQILLNTAEVGSFIKTRKTQFSSEILQQIKKILEKDPQFLKHLHLDPEEAKQLIQQDESIEKMKQVSQTEKYQMNKELWSKWLSEYQEQLKQIEVADADRQKEMKAINPKFTLRNYLLEKAIKYAEQGDYRQLDKLMELATDPFNEELVTEEYIQKPNEEALNICISCSS